MKNWRVYLKRVPWVEGFFEIVVEKIHRKPSMDKECREVFLFMSPRANWMFMMAFPGGIVFGKLFSFLGFEHVHGCIFGIFIGMLSGYFIGKRQESCSSR